ncbi:methyl-accepting chemotaxis protein [Geomonas anaerohicana]|uniref:Methyl-accepting chemotaxis protein n=1 Tax=Geomonas anaerohicana TaxID=2798583 RepID=A0ABS0YJR7_9BACT|nr:methyl-accepting chemotaxis protein [Geomonas anaerohicana]MBJ6752497.1 methyl-accepting chemotaxis protein [Geomonas anaerohicana]
MANLTIAKRLLLGFGTVSLLLFIVVGAGMKGLYSSADQLNNVSRISGLTASAGQVLINLQGIDEEMKGLVLADTQADRDKIAKHMEEHREAYRQALDALKKNTKTPDGKKLVAELDSALTAGTKVNDTLKAIAASGDTARFKAALAREGDPAREKYVAAAEALMDYYAKRSDLRVKTAQEAGTAAITTMLVTGGIAVLICIAISALLTSGIKSALKQISSAIAVIAGGDLTRRIDYRSKDELGQLSDHINDFAGKIQSIMQELSSDATRVATSSNQLKATAQQMVNGTEEIVAQANTVATAGEEMAATSNDIAQNCHLAAQGAQGANQAAVDGAGVVEATVAVMGVIAERVQGAARTVESLGERSDQIGAIVGTIEDIADQTNLLALNAAIEAARAGEQGRGFAVVADEVRALAERTTRATREISDMIRTIQGETQSAVQAMEEGSKEVERGTEQASRSGQALEAILEQIHAVMMQANQIATAAEEQTATTSEISSNMVQITSIVQATAQGADETAAAAAALASMSVRLQDMVRQFKVA